jgi:hypothetical protein
MLPSKPFVIIPSLVLLQQFHLQITVAGTLGSFPLGGMHGQAIQSVSRITALT